MLQPGQTLLGKYRVERMLGEGGMGAVALAQHVHLGTPVAIKWLRPEFLRKAAVVKRFLREAQAAARLQGEHVCRVSDVGALDNGAPYMVMEYMDGADLSQLARARGPLDCGAAVDFMLEACEALAEAHALGIVHRDLKPANLFVARLPDGTSSLKVLDFGISKASTMMDEEITHTHTVLGTPAYMSPEQMRSAKNVDARSDIWSLGIILYQLVQGHRPFRGRAYSELCLQVNGDPTPPMRANVPAGLEDVVRRCLDKNPALRFQNVAELAAALAPFAATGRTAETAVERTARLLGVAPASPWPTGRAPTAQPHMGAGGVGAPPTTLGLGRGEVRSEPGGEPRRSRRTVWLAALGAAALLCVGVGVGVGLRGSPPDTTAASQGAGIGTVVDTPADTDRAGDDQVGAALAQQPPVVDVSDAGSTVGSDPGASEAGEPEELDDEPDDKLDDERAAELDDSPQVDDETEAVTGQATVGTDKKSARKRRRRTATRAADTRPSTPDTRTLLTDKKSSSTDKNTLTIDKKSPPIDTKSSAIDTRASATDKKSSKADNKPSTTDTSAGKKAYGWSGGK